MVTVGSWAGQIPVRPRKRSLSDDMEMSQHGLARPDGDVRPFRERSASVVDVAVFQFFGGGFAHLGHFAFKAQ